MHSVIGRLMEFASVPSNVIACFSLLGLAMLISRMRAGRIVAGGALAAAALASLSPIGNVLLTPLEQRFPELQFPDQRVDGIVVLGGSYDSQSHGYLSTIVLKEDTEPIAVMVDLARRYPEAQIVFSGGTDVAAGASEAAIVKEYFVSFGIRPERIKTEDRSLTTAENARFTAALVRPSPQSRWLLVTSAYHMPRAMGAFRKAGFNVIAFPVGLRTHGWKGMFWPTNNATDNLRRVDIALHEWLGLLYYHLVGYSDQWIAGPQY